MTDISILDLVRVRTGGDARSALDCSRDLAAHAEHWGYTRFWVAEHHNMPGIASAATSLVVSHIAAGTSRIRVGAGGIMLPNHSPLVIAEQFGTLATLYPGRIDLGLGRAPGTDQLTLRALRRNPASAETFPEDVLELQTLLGPVQEGQRIQAVPGAGTNVPLWILGSSLFGAQLAAALGLPFAFASHFAPAARPEPATTAALEDLGRHGVGLAQDRSFRFVLDTVTRAEELGFDITLVAERLVARDLEAWVVASALAVLTHRIQILTAVHPGIVLPQMVAKMGASLDRLSGGRFAVNVVPGRRSHEFDLFGNGSWLADTVARYKRMEEFIDVISGMWTQEIFSLDGDFYKVADGALTTRPMTRPRPPIYAASGSERGMEIIARTCDTWFVSHEPGLAAYESNVGRIAADIEDMRARASRHGRTLGYGLSTYVICAKTQTEAEREAAELESIPDANVAAKALGAGLVGTPGMIADRIRRYEDAGIDCLMLQFHPMRDGLERFGQEIMPRIR